MPSPPVTFPAPARALTAREILEAWERGRGQTAAHRAETLIALAGCGAAPGGPNALPVGGRDARLLEVRELTFGPTARGAAECPRCGEPAEFGLDTAALRSETTEGVADHPETAEVAADGWLVRARAPTGDDLAAAAAHGTVAEGRDELLRRCITGAQRGAEAGVAEELPDGVAGAVAARLAQIDPLANLQLELTCPACRERWTARFDAAEFLWAEVADAAARLLGEVHALARAYGWREADILSMSAARRRAYLELTF